MSTDAVIRFVSLRKTPKENISRYAVVLGYTGELLPLLYFTLLNLLHVQK